MSASIDPGVVVSRSSPGMAVQIRFFAIESRYLITATSGSEKFECATHGEALVCSVVKTFAAAGIQGGDTHSAAQSRLDRRNLICRITSPAPRVHDKQQNENGYHR
jgi:hypothetical protein